MANPVMNRLEEDVRRTPAGYPTMPGYQPGSSAPSASSQPFPTQQAHNAQREREHLEDLYAQPAASVHERVTFDDIVMRSGILFGVLVLTAAISWGLVRTMPSIGMILMTVGVIGGLITGIINSMKSRVSVPLTMAYAICEGLALGALSSVMEKVYPGIVAQAVVATFCVFAGTLVLTKMGVLRHSARMQRTVVIGLVGLIGYSVVSWILMAVGVIGSPYGLDGVTIFGIPLGVVVGVVAVILAVMALVGDMEVARQCVEGGLPREVSWRVAFGFMVTLVWLYIEILRILQLLRAFSE